MTTTTAVAFVCNASECNQCAATFYSVSGVTEKTHGGRKQKNRHAHGKTTLLLPCPACQEPILSCESNANSIDRERLTQLVNLVNTMPTFKRLRTSCIDGRCRNRLRVLSIVTNGRFRYCGSSVL